MLFDVLWVCHYSHCRISGNVYSGFSNKFHTNFSRLSFSFVRPVIGDMLKRIEKFIIAELHARAWSFVELDTTNSFTNVSNKISKINYLIWAGLRHSVPTHLKKSNCLRSEISLILTTDSKEFNILKKKSKDCFMLIKRIIAQCPKNS